MSVYEKLAAVQKELKAPKDKFNKFGGYAYRSAEGILEAVKPLLEKHGALMTITDEVVEVGGRVYIKALAEFADINDLKQHIGVTAYAREPEEKKGMDTSQITGTASSYARKYALNGLLLIDDTKDADTEEYAKQTGKQETVDVKTVKAIAKKVKVAEEELLKQAGAEKWENINERTLEAIYRALKLKEERQ